MRLPIAFRDNQQISLADSTPARVLYYQHDPTRYHPIGAATRQYSPRSPVEPTPSGSDIRINPDPQVHNRQDSWFDINIPTPESSPEPDDVKGKGIAK